MENTKDYIKDIPNAERRFYSSEVELREEEKRTVTGYAAVFNKDSEDFGGWHERIAPGAFDDVIGDEAFALFNHDPNMVLARNGVNMQITQDENGLRYSFEAPNTTLGNDLLELLRSKVITKSSFAFTVKDQAWEHRKGEPSVRTIKKVGRLLDVSPVTYPAYPDTTVGARSFKSEKKTPDFKKLVAIHESILASQQKTK